ncbi:MAG: SIS domain-containing protein [Sulfolobales archaeon]
MIRELLEEIQSNFVIETPHKLNKAYVAGAGDSFAAALAIEGRTRGRFRAVDPYEAQSYEIDLPLIIVSVSGRTRANIELAKRHKTKTKIYVITSNKESELAKLADELILIPYRYRPVPGTLSFLMSLSALYSLAGEEIKIEYREPITMPKEPIFIGLGENFGIAYYAALKMYEIFGERALYERLELFFHAPIFISRNRDIVILSSGDPREDININFARIHRSGCREAFCNTIWVIRSIINRMVSENWDKAFYQESGDILDFSSRMIY